MGEEDAGKQKVHVNLIARNRGMAGIWFNPSNVAGDGYRLRAEVKFKEKGDYKFPNLKVLAARYPVTPLAHSAEIRIWRRASFRGYLNWSSQAENWMQQTRINAPDPNPNAPCPTCNDATILTSLPFTGGAINLAAVAMGAGSTWLFLNAKGDTWGHEIGRHRHFEHAASGPLGAGTSWDRSALRARRHDTANNPGVGLATPSIYGADNSLERGWDRRCLMTYAVWDGGESLFCGKCTMRNRGWRITGMPDPAPDVREPS